MPTFLFDEIIFGPVQSRRLGRSLGVNLLPTSKKFCNYDCQYCECGLNQSMSGLSLVTREQLADALKTRLMQIKSNNETLDAITFAGNGEPTMHPDFCTIVDDVQTIAKQIYGAQIPVVVLSNATMLHRPEIVAALKRCGRPILKLDTAIDKTYTLLNRPVNQINIELLVKNLQQFENFGVIQTMFLYGEIDGQAIDNSQTAELDALIAAYKQINPREVMIYTIQRDTPLKTIQAFNPEQMQAIADTIRRAGIAVKAY